MKPRHPASRESSQLHSGKITVALRAELPKEHSSGFLRSAGIAGLFPSTSNCAVAIYFTIPEGGLLVQDAFFEQSRPNAR